MIGIWSLSALWLGLAPIASLWSIWLHGATVLTGIVVGAVAQLVIGAAVGSAVVQGEGAAADALLAADVIAPDICAALDLLRVPQRLVATLRV